MTAAILANRCWRVEPNSSKVAAGITDGGGLGVRLLLAHEVVAAPVMRRRTRWRGGPRGLCGVLISAADVHSTSSLAPKSVTKLLSDDYEGEANVVVGRSDESPAAGGISDRPHLDLVGVAVGRTGDPLRTGDRCGMSTGKLTGLAPFGACYDRQGRRVYTRLDCEAPIPRAWCSQRLTDCDTATARRINRGEVLWCLAAVADGGNKGVGYDRWQRRGSVVRFVARSVGFLCRVGSGGARRSDTGGKGAKCDQAGQYGGWKEV